MPDFHIAEGQDNSINVWSPFFPGGQLVLLGLWNLPAIS